MSLSLTVPSGTFLLAGIPIWVKITGASAPSGSTGYKVLLKVTSEDGLIVGGPFIDAVAPLSGEALFDASGYCNQPVTNEFEWPLTGGLNPYGDQTREVNFTAGECYIDEDGELVETWGTATGTHYIVNGGISNRRQGEFNDLSSSFYAYYVTGKRFLTYFPDNMVVYPYQPLKLWFLAASDYSATVKIKGYYEDGSSYEKGNSHTFYENIMHEINFMPYHMDATNLAPVKGGVKMTHFEAWIDGVTAKSTFIVDHSYHEQCNYLFTLNGLGGIDVIWLNGEVTEKFPTESVQAFRPFPEDGTAQYPTLLVASRTGQKTWSINTGWKSAGEIRALKDALLSRQAWLLESAEGYNKGTLTPVVVQSYSDDLINSSDDMFAIELELIEAHKSEYL